MSQTNQIPHNIAGKATNRRTGGDSACDKDSELQTNGSSCAHSSACALTGQKVSCTQDSEQIHRCRDDDNGEGTKQSTFPWKVNATEVLPTDTAALMALLLWLACGVIHIH